MKARIALVTPAMAKAILEKNRNNRPLSQPWVDKYARELEAGQWKETHQGIGIDARGNLLDGQHRLHAIIKTGIPVRMVIVTDLEASSGRGLGMTVMDAIDRGRPRSVAQQLALSHGFSNASCHASWLNSAVATLTGRRVSAMGQVLECLRIYGKDIDALLSVKSMGRVPALVAGPCVVVHNFAPEVATEFAGYYASNDGGRTHPAMVVKRWMEYHPNANHIGGQARLVVLTGLYSVAHSERPQKIIGSIKASDWVALHQAANLRKVSDILGLPTEHLDGVGSVAPAN